MRRIHIITYSNMGTPNRCSRTHYQQNPSNVTNNVPETQKIQTNLSTATGVSTDTSNRTQRYVAGSMTFEMRKRLLNVSLANPR
jgi:hypothetical protein